MQFSLALLLGGVITQVWNNYVQTYHIDPFVSNTVSVFLGAWIVYLQNQREDKTGKGFLLPKDRMLGDAVTGAGVGVAKVEAAATTGKQV